MAIYEVIRVWRAGDGYRTETILVTEDGELAKRVIERDAMEHYGMSGYVDTVVHVVDKYLDMYAYRL